jgi:hypothetical protein
MATSPYELATPVVDRIIGGEGRQKGVGDVRVRRREEIRDGAGQVVRHERSILQVIVINKARSALISHALGFIAPRRSAGCTVVAERRRAR